MEDRHGNVLVAVYKSAKASTIAGVYKKSVAAVSSATGLGMASSQFNGIDQIDPYTGGDLIEFYRQQGNLCELVCVGIWDSVSTFVADLANWIQVAGTLGATLRAIEGIVAGAEAAAILAAAGLGAVVGGAVVVAFAGGWLIGTGINSAIDYVIYKDGHVVKRN